MPIVTRPDERHRLVRNVRVIRGRMDFRLECRPAFDYARRDHSVSVGKSGAVFSSGESCLGLATDVRLEEWDGGAAGARFSLGAGERATFVLAHLDRGEGPGEILSDVGFEELLHRTLQYWRGWLANSTYHGRWREMVHRSALVLKLMVYDPTGALVASPTMGLPESIGGEKDWDYRYTWLYRRGARALRPDLRRLRGRGPQLHGLAEGPLPGGQGRPPAAPLRHRRPHRRSRGGTLASVGVYELSPRAPRQWRPQPEAARPVRGGPRRGVPLQQVRRAPRLRPLAESRQDPELAQRQLEATPTRASGRCAGY